MALVEGGAPGDTSATTSTVPASSVPLPAPPPPPPRKFPRRNKRGTKISPKASQFCSLPFDMETKPDPSAPPHTVPSYSQPEAHLRSVKSPLPPNLPPPPERYPCSSSPPLPPPPPSYLFSELTSEDLPLPPPPQLFPNVSSPPPPLYIYSYDPPSPEIKSEYDPPLPHGFSSKFERFPSLSLPRPLPPPPRPTPPPPPTPPVRHLSRENLVVPPHPSLSDATLCTAVGRLYIDSKYPRTLESLSRGDDEFCKNIKEGTPDGRPPSSLISSSTLTATFLQTPESGMSPLPPHALRVSPLPTDAITPSSQMTDDFTMTPLSSDMTYTSNFYDTSKDSTIDLDTPDATPQLSETPGTNPCTPTGEAVSPVLSKSPEDTAVLPHYLSSPYEIGDRPDSSRSECSLLVDEKDSASEKTNSTLTDRSNLETLVGLNTATSTTTGHAQMSSPLSTEPPSLFSLPTDSDTISADFDSFGADALSPAAEFDSLLADVDTSVDTNVNGRALDTHLTNSSSGFSDTAYATAESALDSATISPAFTESCTITPVPHDHRTPLSTNPTATPIPSPIPTEALSPTPSSPLLYSDTYSSAHLTLPLTCEYSPFSNTQAVKTSTVSLTSSEDHSVLCKASNMKRLVRSQTSESSVVASVRHSYQVMPRVPLISPNTSQHTHSHQTSLSAARQDHNGILQSSDVSEKMVKNNIKESNNSEVLRGHRYEFKESEQNFKHSQVDELPVKLYELEKPIKQTLGNIPRGRGEGCSPDKSELIDISQDITRENDISEKVALDVDKDSKGAKLEQQICSEINGMKLNDAQKEENEKSQEDIENAEETSKDALKISKDKDKESKEILAVTHTDIHQYTYKDEIPQNNSQEGTSEYYEAEEDVNGNISYVTEDEQKECQDKGIEVEKKSSINKIMKGDYEEEDFTKGLIVGSKITSEGKEPVEVIGDKEVCKDIIECLAHKDENVKGDDVTAVQDKIPVTCSLPLWKTEEQADFYHPSVTSPSHSSPCFPAPRWNRASLPSSPTHTCAISSQFYTFPHVPSLLSKSVSVPSSPLPHGATSAERTMSPTITHPSAAATVAAGMERGSPKRKSETSLPSVAPEESMQILNAVVTNLENMSACLPASQYPKQEKSSLKSLQTLTDGSLDCETETAKASLHQEDKVCVDSDTRSVFTSENQTQGRNSSNQEEALHIHVKSESIKSQYLDKSSDNEIEILNTKDAEKVLPDIYISGSSKVCDIEFTKDEDDLKNEKCMSANICPEIVMPNDQQNVTQSTLDNSKVSCPTDDAQDYCAFSPGIIQSDCQHSHPSVISITSSSNRLSSACAGHDASITLSNACHDTSVTPFPSLQCDDHMVNSTNTDFKGEVLKRERAPGDEALVNTVQEDTVQITTTCDQKLLAENSASEDIKALDLGINITTTMSQSCVERVQSVYDNENHLDSESLTVEKNSNINCAKAKKKNDSSSLLSFSPGLGSILEDVAPSSPAPCAKTPPPPPPRSCVSTPKQALGVPLPPPRQYMLIPINQPQDTMRRLSPPPAPPRTTSVRKSSPPSPPPRTGGHTVAAKNEWIDFPPLPPPPTSCINTPSTPPPKLTPVPEESLSPSTPVPSAFASPRVSQAGSSPIDGTVRPEQGTALPKTLLVSEECTSASSSLVTYPKEQMDESQEKESSSNTRSHIVSSVIESTSVCLNVSDRSGPPAVPPPPVEFEEEPPPPPTPPLESEDESVPPLPLPPPPDALLYPPPPPPPPLSLHRIKATPTFLPSPKSSASESEGYPLSPDHDAQLPNSCSIPPPSVPENISSYMSTIPPPPTLSTSKIPAVPPPPTQSPASLTLPQPAPPLPPTSLSSPNPSSPRAPKSGAEAAPRSPLITTTPYGKLVIIRSDLPLPSPEEEVRSIFANVKDWGLLNEDVDTVSLYTQLRPVIQQGPQCGLVALSMASQVFPETVDVVDLLKAAKTHGFSCHGEMFSSDAMAKLAEGINSMEASVRRDVLCNPRTVLELLMQGDLILVPYDAERNYMPGLRGGYKAHWGVICGCLVQCQFLNVHMGGASKPDSRVDYLYHLRPRSRVGISSSVKSRDGSMTPSSTPTAPGSPWMGNRTLETPDQAVFSPVFDSSKITEISRKEGSTSRCSEIDTWNLSSSRVNTPMLPEFFQDEIKLVALIRQGKSRKLIAAPLEKLCESNDQLAAYPPPTTPLEMEYIIGSVQDGLAGQVVVLHKTKPALSDLVGILQEKKPC
ncbi:uncharacterized protein [Panulirus ornatus]|uniref:uncharacterized protein n=1 Tax=Panulirus ornatus TaxID=150431 RepID=UPI003A8B40EE